MIYITSIDFTKILFFLLLVPLCFIILNTILGHDELSFSSSVVDSYNGKWNKVPLIKKT